jgi:hypothetical protein
MATRASSRSNTSNHRAAARVQGRERELAALLTAVEDVEGPTVLFLHGIAGIGKSTILHALAGELQSRGFTVMLLDARQIEPTERGFLQELQRAAGGVLGSVEDAADRLAALGDRVVLLIDTYEVFRLMDTWVRQVLVPALPGGARVVLAGREPPVQAWHTAPVWRGLFRSVEIDALPEPDALALLEGAGVTADAAARINRTARGHPLALTLAAASLSEGPVRDIQDTAVQSVVDALTRTYLAELDPAVRDVLEAVAGVRRVTEPLLAAVLPDVPPRDAYDRLHALPFVQEGRDGLIVHDAVRQAIAAHVHAADPRRYRDARWRAWECLRDQIHGAARSDVWRYTADILYLIEHPVIREAFFPSGAQPLAVEPAGVSDGPAIATIIERHEGPENAAHLQLWWQRNPEAFRVFRDAGDRVAGFYIRAERRQVHRDVARLDPVTAGWLRHLREFPVGRGETVLFSRRWLDAQEGELPSAGQAAAWLDIKGLYVLMRESLRRVYLTVRELDVYAEVATELGFRPIEHGTVTLDGQRYHAAYLDFGPNHVEGWLGYHVRRELGGGEAVLLDAGAHEAIVEGSRIALAPLEFGVLALLDERRGRAVSRADLLERVWGYPDDGGSNVVDVTVRGLRRKLGGRASLVETVRGVGYRLRDE